MNRRVYAVLLVPLLLAADAKKGCACRGKPDPDTGTGEPIVVLTPDQALEVVSLEPSVAKPDTKVTASLFGGGFAEGLTVKVGPTAVAATYKSANAAKLEIPGLAEGVYDVVVTNPDGTAATLRRGYVVKVGAETCRFVRVQFEFDRAEPTADALKTLEGLTSCYLAAQEIVIDGHADERGTTEYNLALGERRAEAIQRWLVGAGVLQSRIRTVSYGEEKPLSTGHDEAAWAQNRRAEVKAHE